MKGREAIRSAQRREVEAKARREALEDQLAEERRAHKAEVLALEEEVRRLKSDHLAEAKVLAQDELQRLMAKQEEERRQKGLSDDIVIHFMYQKDKFIRNACRYISMTTGFGPDYAFGLVMTWMTDKDFSGLSRTDRFIDLGVPNDGWVAHMFGKRQKYWTKVHSRRGSFGAISLDRAEAEGHSAIHERYNPEWYPPIEYDGIEVIGDDGHDEAATDE